MNLRRATRGIIIAAMLSALVYAALAALTDTQSIAASLRGFPLSTLAWMFALTLGCYLLRAARWWYLMRFIGHPMSGRDAVYTQLSGMTMTVTPGKVGEVLKAYLAREFAGLPMASGVAVVFCERLADLIAVIALSAGAISVLGSSLPALVIIAVAVAGGTALLNSKRFHAIALRAAERQPWLRTHHGSAAVVSGTVRTMLAPRPLVTSTVISVVAWSLEGVAFALCIRALGFDGLSVAAAVAVYAISTILGALTFLPGGIGLTEASMAGLLIAAGMSGADASAATLLIRVVTMWFGVALGWVVLFTRPSVVTQDSQASTLPRTSSSESLAPRPQPHNESRHACDERSDEEDRREHVEHAVGHQIVEADTQIRPHSRVQRRCDDCHDRPCRARRNRRNGCQHDHHQKRDRQPDRRVLHVHAGEQPDHQCHPAKRAQRPKDDRQQPPWAHRHAGALDFGRSRLLGHSRPSPCCRYSSSLLFVTRGRDSYVGRSLLERALALPCGRLVGAVRLGLQVVAGDLERARATAAAHGLVLARAALALEQRVVAQVVEDLGLGPDLARTASP